jgi:hypothetical protein
VYSPRHAPLGLLLLNVCRVPTQSARMSGRSEFEESMASQVEGARVKPVPPNQWKCYGLSGGTGVLKGGVFQA